MIKSKQAVQEQLATLQSYLADCPDGEILSWVAIEQATGVNCGSPRNQRERELVRRALKKLGRPYETLIGTGITLSSPANACRISESHKRGVWRKIGRASKVTGQLVGRHLDDMRPDEKQSLLLTNSILGGLKLAGKQSRQHERKDRPQLVAPSGPMLPNDNH